MRSRDSAQAGVGAVIAPAAHESEARALPELALDRATLRTILEHLVEGVVVADMAGQLLYCNSAALAMHGFASLAECQRRLPEIAELFEVSTLDGQVLAQEHWPLARILRGKSLLDMDLRVRRRDILCQHVLSYGGTLVRDTRGRARMALLTVYDLTRQNITEARRSQQLGRLAEELTLAEQRERKRLAQFLHDELQQLLVAVRMQVAALRTCAPARLDEAVQQTDALIGQALDMSRNLTMELAPPVLHDAGLMSALRWLAHRMQEQHGLTVEIEGGDEAADASESMRTLLFQSVRELLFNTVKHARVERARVSVQRQADRLRIVVSDQGQGFDTHSLGAARSFETSGNDAGASGTMAGGGFGLSSTRERLALLGGYLTIHSAPGQGVIAILDAPAPKPPGGNEVNRSWSI